MENVDQADITKALKNVENALRDFIASVLRDKYGDDWISESGVTEDKIDEWRSRMRRDAKQQKGGTADQRLLYYGSLYDLKTILKKHWSGEFSTALGKWKRIEVFLDELKVFRDSEAHRRELLSHQKHLVLGIAGEIRNQLVAYRSEMETSEDYYPRIESVKDNLGNTWTPSQGGKNVRTSTRIRVGDKLEFIVAAADPRGEPLKYSVRPGAPPTEWEDSNVLSFRVKEKHVGRVSSLAVRIKSTREYHAKTKHDDQVTFIYEVLPPE